jgi:hypothetical protein
MKKPIFTAFRRYIAAAFAIGASLLLSSTISLGDIHPTAATSGKDCRLVANPDACYRQQSDPQWTPYNPNFPALLPPLNTDTLGLSGPFGAELKYDADLQWILGARYLHMFTDSLGLATKLTGGANELRANLTAGYALTKDQQIKLTYEYLTQNLPFTFASGSVDEWVNQNSVGVAYQYVIRHAIVHSLELSGYTTRAHSKDLDDITFNQQVIPTNLGGGYLYDVNYRHIAGGNENTVLASVNLFPFADDKTTLTLGAGYSDIRYNTHFEDNQAASRPAYKAEVTHLLSSKTKISATSTGSAAYAENRLGFNHLLPKKFEASLSGQYTSGQGTLPDNKSLILGFTYPAPDKYSLSNFGDVQEFKNWIDKPVIYATRVLAIKDEAVKRFEFRAGNPLPDQVKHIAQIIDPVSTTSAFIFTDPNLQVIYSAKAIKISGAPAPSDKNFIPDLDLGFVSNGPNQATFQSLNSTGIPALDSDNLSTVGVYQITLTAIGVANGKSFTVSNGFKLTVLPLGPAVLWTGVDTLQQGGVAGQPYTPLDLNGLPGAQKLVKTYDINGNEVSDTYDFVVDQTFSSQGWVITGTGTLTNLSPDAGVNHITLLATSIDMLSGISAKNGNHPPAGAAQIRQDITVTIVPPGQTIAGWVSDVVPNGTGGSSYSVNLNNILEVSPPLAKTKVAGTPVADTYTFHFDPMQSIPAGWSIVGDGTLTHSGPLAPGTVPMTLIATSNVYGVPVSIDGNHPGDATKQDIVITVGNTTDVPTFGDTEGAIRFDLTGDLDVDSNLDPALGRIVDGVFLNNMISNNPRPNLCFGFGDSTNTATNCGDTAPQSGNWRIAETAPSSGNFYLLRYRDTSTTPATVSAIDVGENNTVPSIKVCNTNANVCTTSTATGSQIIQVLVKPDPGLQYKQSSSTPEAKPIDGATSNGNGGVHPNIGISDLLLSEPALSDGRTCVSAPSPTTSDCLTTVLNDNFTTYTVSSATPTYMNVAGLPTIKFTAPDAAEYAALADTPLPGLVNYVRAESVANGGNPGGIDNVLNLPPIEAGKLILVPYQGDICNSSTGTCFTGSNLSTNVGAGVNQLGQPPGPLARDTIIGLAVTLPSSSKKYYLVRFNVSFPGGASFGSGSAGICPSALMPQWTAPTNSNQYPTNTLLSDLTKIVDGSTVKIRCSGVQPIAEGFSGGGYSYSGPDLLLPSGGGGASYTFYATGSNVNNGIVSYNSSLNPNFPLGIPSSPPIKYTDIPTRTSAGTSVPLLGQNYTLYPAVKLK